MHYEDSNDSMDQEGQLVSHHDLLQLLQETIPLDTVVHAFGYGSGVFAQELSLTTPTTTAASSSSSNTITTSSDSGSASPPPRIDLIVIVSDAFAFHTENLRRNPQHYPPSYSSGSSSSSALSASRAAWVQRHKVRLPLLPIRKWLANPGLYFCVTDSMKYGIVQDDDVTRDDLVQWSYLYLAGRLHKPVVSIYNANDDDCGGSCDDNAMMRRRVHDFHAAQNNCNLPAALSTALLLDWSERQQESTTSTTRCRGTVTEASIYQQIASLSYRGDPRMAVAAEDPLKIQKLVWGSAGQWARFQALYRPAVQRLVEAGILSVSTSTATDTQTVANNDVEWSWDETNPLAHARLWQSVPESVRSQCGYTTPTTTTTTKTLTMTHSNTTAATTNTTTQPLLSLSAPASAAAHQLSRVIPSIVAPAARYQSLKGLWTAGLGPSAAYVWRKLSKGLLRRR
jgi:mitochondrial translocator assembly and maintenance protein 41